MSSAVYTPDERATFASVPPAEGRSHIRWEGYEVTKRLIDVVGSIALLVFCLPLLLVVVASIKLDSPGPVLFRQRRLGRNGRTFQCYKFRTMVQDAEVRLASSRELSALFEANFKIKRDPRVTRFGAFLRRTSLDELPQIWNVLRGEMSLIGPRPIVEHELIRYEGFGNRLLAVKPGLGGVWQVNGRSETTYNERVAMDMSYIESRTIALDLLLLVRTALVVIQGRGAY